MTYRVRMMPPAKRDLARLPERVAAAVLEFMADALVHEPLRVGKPLQDDLAGYLCARRGVYRIVYDIDAPARVVKVHRIDHRADVYRPRLRPYAA